MRAPEFIRGRAADANFASYLNCPVTMATGLGPDLGKKFGSYLGRWGLNPHTQCAGVCTGFHAQQAPPNYFKVCLHFSGADTFSTVSALPLRSGRLWNIIT